MNNPPVTHYCTGTEANTAAANPLGDITDLGEASLRDVEWGMTQRTMGIAQKENEGREADRQGDMRENGSDFPEMFRKNQLEHRPDSDSNHDEKQHVRDADGA